MRGVLADAARRARRRARPRRAPAGRGRSPGRPPPSPPARRRAGPGSRPPTAASRVCTFAETEWPVYTGTRAQVAEMRQVVAVQDLARLAHHLALLGGVVVAVLEALHLRHHVERDLVRVDARRRGCPWPRAWPASGRGAPPPPAGPCPTRPGRWRPPPARCRRRRGSASAPPPSASWCSWGWPRSRGGRRARRGSPRPPPAARRRACARRTSCPPPPRRRRRSAGPTPR